MEKRCIRTVQSRITEKMKEEVIKIVAEGHFGTESAYLRWLVQKDIDKRRRTYGTPIHGRKGVENG